jgi:hypothetical protein
MPRLRTRYNGREHKAISTIEELKRYGLQHSYTEELFYKTPLQEEDLEYSKDEKIATKLYRYFSEKGISHRTIDTFSNNNLGKLFSGLALRTDNPKLSTRIDKALSGISFRGRYKVAYGATQEENLAIDEAIARSELGKDFETRKFTGSGTTPLFSFSSEYSDSNTPIVIIGGGPAGLMTIEALFRIGFNRKNILVIDKSGSYGGIWNYSNVAEGSINNPFPFNFLGVRLAAAPGRGSKVVRFLRDMESRDTFTREYKPPLKGEVIEVVPGDLNHKVVVRIGGQTFTLNSPIVINATGTGKPLNPNREGHMETSTPEKAGIRWQQIIDEETARRYEKKMLVLIGLGNSTAEMLMQIEKLQRDGWNGDYRILTHYPQEAVFSPKSHVIRNGREYRVFRDLSKPILTKYEGDLDDAKSAYFNALCQKRFIPNVTGWNVEGDKITVKVEGENSISFKYGQIYTLIGYGHDPELMTRMGMKVIDRYTGAVATDFDGEVHRANAIGRNRRSQIYPGYFVIGAVARTKTNPNAAVMPGMMHRLYDMLLAIALRAEEYNDRQLEEHVTQEQESRRKWETMLHRIETASAQVK